MNQYDRVQYFSIALARHAFTHPVHGLCFAKTAVRIEEVKGMGFMPLVLFAITVPGTAIQWIRLGSVTEPDHLMSVLADAWRDVKQLRGHPDCLVVSRHIEEACPALRFQLAQIGVTLQLPETNSKRYATAIRSAQDLVHYVVSPWKDNPPCVSLTQFGTEVIKQLDWEEQIYHYTIGNKARAEATLLHLRSPKKELPKYEWAPTAWIPGTWAQSWEANLPPSTNGKILTREPNGQCWLIDAPSNHAIRSRRELDTEDDVVDHRGILTDLLKMMIACWPNRPLELATSIGVTLRDLTWYLRGRELSLEAHEVERLLMFLGIEWNESYGYEVVGECVLIGNKVRSTKAAYEELSHGGDLEFAAEVLPASGCIDPSWRYVLLIPCGSLPSVIMVQRGSVVADILGPEHLINFHGIHEIPAELYQLLVSACARATRSPKQNRIEMLSFYRANLNRLLEHIQLR